VPLATVYAAGDDNYVFVQSGDGPKPVKVSIGGVNDTHAQIKQGLSVGDRVLILQAGQGRELLEKAGIKIIPKKTEEQPAKPAKSPVPPAPPAAPPQQSGAGVPTAGDNANDAGGDRKRRAGLRSNRPKLDAAPTTMSAAH